MLSIMAFAFIAAAGYCAHSGYYGWALFLALGSIPYLIQMGVYWAFEAVLKKLEFRAVQIPTDFPVEFPPKIKKDEEN